MYTVVHKYAAADNIMCEYIYMKIYLDIQISKVIGA